MNCLVQAGLGIVTTGPTGSAVRRARLTMRQDAL